MTLRAIDDLPIVPYIRQCDFPVRAAYYSPKRKLLDYLMIHIKKGELRIEADGAVYRLGEGDFCLLQPGTTHDLSASAANETPFVHMDIFWHPERDRSFPTRPGQVNLEQYAHLMQPRLNDIPGISLPVVLHPSHSAKYAQLLNRMIADWLSPDLYGKLSAQACGTQLVHDILRDHARSDAARPTSAGGLDWVHSYLSFHLSDPLSIEDMARRAHLSVSRFREVFRQRFGLPPHQYLIRLRLAHAEELLRNTDLSLARIAEYCGFVDISHFANSFKTHRGMAPGMYRSSHSRSSIRRS
ncbi:AraC family transcriptional regulator [Cohnella sp. 56]|uniref:AraC family transcriptional regulator n=1 Tax=Cohnella sp. 56 TaxID=3113722 RepID=UPI0030E99CB8